MSKYKVHALTDSSWLKPDGDGYAPQVMLTHESYGSWNSHDLNAESIPLDGEQLAQVHSALGNDAELTARWARIVTGCNVIAVNTRGSSQGDYGTVFVFDTPEFREVTGADGITSEDATDLAAWIWGDVYEVIELEHYTVGFGGFPGSRVCSCGATCCEEENDEENTFTVYGMAEAMKYGEIVFPTRHSYESYDD